MSHVILANGDKNYIQPAFDAGYKGIYAQDSIFPFDGSTTTAPQFTNVSNSISSNRHVMPRWFATENKYMVGGVYPNGENDHVDDLAAMSTGSDKFWAQEFTHQVILSSDPAQVNGGITWARWKSLMDHIENAYGRYGNDTAWVAGAEEVYDYLMVKQNIGLTSNLVGNQLTINLDSTNVPADLKHYALSLKINSDAEIDTITYGSAFSYHTANTTS